MNTLDRIVTQLDQALRALHTESVVVQQTYGGMMSWDDYKAFPRPDPPSPKNRREKYKLWQAKKSWEQKLLHFTGPAPSSVTVGSITQTSVDLIVTFPKDLPKLFFKEVFDCFYVSGFTVFDIVVPDENLHGDTLLCDASRRSVPRLRGEIGVFGRMAVE